jgi:hypothetical protein
VFASPTHRKVRDGWGTALLFNGRLHIYLMAGCIKEKCFRKPLNKCHFFETHPSGAKALLILGTLRHG